MPSLVILTALAVASVLLAVRAERDLVAARNGSGRGVPFGRWSAVVAAAIPAVLALAVVLGTGADPLEGAAGTATVAVALVAAVAGGAPLALAVLHLADPDPRVAPPPGTPPPTASPPAGVLPAFAATDPGSGAAPAPPPTTAGPADPWLLRGGFWIGVLERAAVAFCVVTGWPEGIALVLVVKGFGRYPELQFPPAAERFIIGTLVSVLWAAACAWTALFLIR